MIKKKRILEKSIGEHHGKPVIAQTSKFLKILVVAGGAAFSSTLQFRGKCCQQCLAGRGTDLNVLLLGEAALGAKWEREHQDCLTIKASSLD